MVEKEIILFHRRHHPHECFYCGVQLHKGKGPQMRTKDHVIPLSQKGRSSGQNLVPACAECNSKKGGMTANEFRQLMGPTFYGEREYHRFFRTLRKASR